MHLALRRVQKCYKGLLVIIVPANETSIQTVLRCLDLQGSGILIYHLVLFLGQLISKADSAEPTLRDTQLHVLSNGTLQPLVCLPQPGQNCNKLTNVQCCTVSMSNRCIDRGMLMIMIRAWAPMSCFNVLFTVGYSGITAYCKCDMLLLLLLLF